MGKSKKKAAKAEAAAQPAALVGVQKVQKNGKASKTKHKKHEKPLILCARGITFRYRHLMTDLMQLVPHCKSDSKLDTKHDWNVINEIAELKGATSVMFFEARKRQDLYVWLAKVPTGPTIRFFCTNVHTMAELKLSGNHLKGSRPVLSFDKAFDLQPHLQLIKEMLTQVFVMPKGHQKSKPYFDHVISFSWADNRVWLRNYQVVTALDKKQVKPESITLVEVGPRATLQPIKIFAGSFRGKVLFENPEFISPNAVRSYEKKKAAGTYSAKVKASKKAKDRKERNKVELNQLAGTFAPVTDSDGDEEQDLDDFDDDDEMVTFD